MYALSAAIRRADIDALGGLLVRPEILGSLNDPREGVMYIAVTAGSCEVVEVLLAAGASPNVPSSGRSGSFFPLVHAAADANDPMVELLIRAGADINVCGIFGTTPLYACRTLAAAEKLLAAGADPRLPGATPCLLGPAASGNLDVTKVLIAAGADPSARDPRPACWTALHAAAHNCRPEMVEVLLAAGSDPLAKESKGKTALRVLQSGTPRQRQAIAAALVAAGDRTWAHVPTPCAGLQRALIPTWKQAPGELSELFRRLEPAVQARARAALAVFHPHGLPVELRMRLLAASLEESG